jgi:hypothetical protein
MSYLKPPPDRGLKIRKFTRETAVVALILAVFFFYARINVLALISCLVVAGIVALIGEIIGGGTAGPRRSEVESDFEEGRRGALQDGRFDPDIDYRRRME